MPAKRKPPLLLEATSLTVERETHILRDLNWQVRRGEHWAVLGPNGSGKSSLLNVFTAFLAPTTGRIRAFGKEYGEDDWNEIKARIGYAGSEVNRMIRPEETVLDLLIGGARAMINFWGEYKPAERRAARAFLKRADCLPLEHRPWRLLSQGERQKILFGRALMGKPAALFLDEPCAGLDPVARASYLAFMERSASTAPSPVLVLVTHHVEEITPCFTHVLILREGQVLAAGPKKQTLTAANLTKAFGAPIKLRSAQGRYLMTSP